MSDHTGLQLSCCLLGLCTGQGSPATFRRPSSRIRRHGSTWPRSVFAVATDRLGADRGEGGVEALAYPPPGGELDEIFSGEVGELYAYAVSQRAAGFADKVSGLTAAVQYSRE
jgi:hypothetical protein